MTHPARILAFPRRPPPFIPIDQDGVTVEWNRTESLYTIANHYHRAGYRLRYAKGRLRAVGRAPS